MADKEGLLPFKLIEDESGEALTSFSGLPLVVETCEALGLPRLVNRHVRIKQRDRGYSESKYVESVIALIAAGGDCLDDMELIGSDAGLKLLLGEMPSAEAVRFFLYGFHEEWLLEGRPEEGAFIAQETEPLVGLWEVNRGVMKRKALPNRFWPVRMKALRFHLIGVAAKVVSHARMKFLKITGGLIGYREARSHLVEFSSA